MKKNFLSIVSIILMLSNAIKAQTNNNFENEKWQLTCRVWGLLKYHAPNTEKKASKQVDWDGLLFESIKSIENAQNSTDLQNIVSDWVKKAGEYEKGDAPKMEEGMMDIVDLSWVENTTHLTASQKLYLKNVRWRKSRNTNEYFHQNIIGIMKTDENIYEKETKLSKNMKILTVFRAWNFAEYFFPYKNYMDKKWEDCLTAYLPLFLKEQSNNQFYFDLRRMTAHLQDGHVVISANPESPIIRDTFQLPISLVRFEKDYVVDKIALNNKEINELKEGDKILKINNINIKTYIDSIKQAMSYTNEKTGETVAISNYMATKNPNAIFSYDVMRGEEKMTLKAQNIGSRIEWSNTDKTPYKVLEGNIGYINLSYLTDNDLDKAMAAVQNCPSLVIDSRGYPIMKRMKDFLSYFSDGKKLKYLTFKANYGKELGIFHPFQDDYRMSKSKFDYQGKIMVLTSPRTQSYAETITMMLNEHTNAKFIGQQTSSSNGNVMFCDLPYGLKMRITGLWTGNVDGSQYQKKGTIPDIWVEYNPFSNKNGIDNQLNEAIKIIKENEDRP